MGNGLRAGSQVIPEMLRGSEWKFVKGLVWAPLQADHRWASLPPATAVSLLCRSSCSSGAFLPAVGYRVAER
jgi:hypothetical protein